MNKPQALSVSIVIPVFNDQNHLKKCLQAISKQSVMPDEVIVVDNNSTDGSAAVAKQFKFVKILSQAKQGVLYARTTGFNAAKSEIIGRIDADTQLPPDWTRRVQEIFIDSKVAAATGPAYWYDMPLAPYNYVFEHSLKQPLYKLEKDFPFLFGTNMAIRRTVWRAVTKDLCDRRDIHEDVDLAVHLHRAGHKIIYDRKLKAGASSRRFDDKPRDFLRYQKMMSQTFKVHGIEPTGSKIARFAFSLGYVTFYPLRRAYDPVTSKRSVKHFLVGRNPARKNPMH